MEDILLVGYGGHTKSVADTIERLGKYRISGYTDLEDSNSKYLYLGTDEKLESIFNSGIRNAFICVGYMGKGNIREKIYDRLKEIGYNLPVMIDPSAIVSASSSIEEGTFVGKFSLINADAKIGKCSIINTGAIIEHESTVGEFSHISVGAVLCGQVIVGRGAFVGANATVIQCRKISDYTIVPAGETVRKNQ